MTSIAQQVAARREQDARRAQAVRRRVFWAGAEGAEADAIAAYLGWSRMGVLTELRRLAAAGEVVPKRNSRGQERWFLVQEGERREPAPAPVAAPETGEADQTAGAGAAVPSETPPPTPSGHGSDEEGTTREVRPTSPAAPTAGDTPPSSGEQEASPTGEPVAALPTPPGCAPGGADGDDHGASVGAMEGAAPLHVGDESPGRVAAPGGETGPGLDCSTRPDVPPAAPAGVTTASSVEREPTSPPESTMRYPEILEHVRQHPGQTVAEVAAALGLDQGTLRGRLQRHGAAMGVEIRAEGPPARNHGPAKPHRLFLSSPSPSSPPGEAAPASGGDLCGVGWCQPEGAGVVRCLRPQGHDGAHCGSGAAWTDDVSGRLPPASGGDPEAESAENDDHLAVFESFRSLRERANRAVLPDPAWTAPAWLAEALDLDDGESAGREEVEAALRQLAPRRDPEDIVHRFAEALGMGSPATVPAERVIEEAAALTRALDEHRAAGAQFQRERDARMGEAGRLGRQLAETAARAQCAERERDEARAERELLRGQVLALELSAPSSAEDMERLRQELAKAVDRAQQAEQWLMDVDRELGLDPLGRHSARLRAIQDQQPDDLDAAHARADKRYARVRELEEQVQHLQDLAAKRGQDRDDHAVEASTLTVLVEQALSAAGLPAAGDDPLLFRLGRLVERLKAAEVPQ